MPMKYLHNCCFQESGAKRAASEGFELCPIPINHLVVIAPATQTVQHTLNPFFVVTTHASLLCSALLTSADFYFHTCFPLSQHKNIHGVH